MRTVRVVVDARGYYSSAEDVPLSNLVNHLRRVWSEVSRLVEAEEDLGEVTASFGGPRLVTFAAVDILPWRPWAVCVEGFLVEPRFYIFRTFRRAWTAIVMGEIPGGDR